MLQPHVSELPALRIRLAEAYVTPIARNASHIAAMRSSVTRELQHALALFSGSVQPQLRSVLSPVDVGGGMLYYLTYHGLNDVHLREQLAALYDAIWPELHLIAPHVPHWRLSDVMPWPYSASSNAPPALRRRLRVCFVSALWHQHSVTKMISRLVATLPRAIFHVTLFAFPCPRDDVHAHMR